MTRITLARILATLALIASAQAHAATAYLLNCQNATSVTGQLIWVGTYQYGSQVFTRTFGNSGGMCPLSVTVY